MTQQERQRELRHRTGKTYAEESDDESELVEGQEDQQEAIVGTKRRGNRASRQAVKKGKKRHAEAIPVVEPMENAMFNTSYVDFCLTWITEYELNQERAITELVNFLFKCAGCETEVAQHDVAVPESAALTIQQVQEKATKYMTKSYPLVSTEKAFRKFAASVGKFTGTLMECAAERGLLDDDDFLEALSTWVSPLIGSPVEPFRHTATVFLCHVLTELCRLFSDKTRVLENLENELNEAKKRVKGATGKATARPKRGAVKESIVKHNESAIRDIPKRIEDETEKKHALSLAIERVHSVVFLRARDSVSKIRNQVGLGLAQWLIICPELFLAAHRANENVKFLLDAMHDPVGLIRLHAVSTFTSIYSHGQAVAAYLRQVTPRIVPDLRNVVKRDVDHRVRREAVRVLTLLAKLGYLEGREIDDLQSLVFDVEISVRREAAAFVVSVADQEAEELRDNTTSGFVSDHENWVKLKTLGKVLERINGLDSTGEDNHDEGFDSDIGNAVYGFFHKAAVPRIVAAAASCAAVTEFQIKWQELVEMLLYDFSHVGEEEAMLCSVEGLEVTLLDMLCGFISHCSSANSSFLSTSGELLDHVPLLLDKFQYSPSAVQSTIRLWSLVDFEAYTESHKENLYKPSLDSVLTIFLEPSALGPVISECAEVFRKGANTPFASEETKILLQRTLSECLEELVGLTRGGLLDIDRVAWKPLLTSLHRVDTLSLVVSTVDGMGRSVGDHNVCQRLLMFSEKVRVCIAGAGDIDNAVDSNLLECLALLFPTLKAYAFWALGTIMEKTAEEDETAHEESATSPSSLRDIGRILAELDAMFGVNNLIIKTLAEICTLEIVLAVRQAILYLETSGRGVKAALLKVPGYLSEESVRNAFIVFLQLEKEYAKSAGKQIKGNDIDILCGEDEDSDSDDEENADNQESKDNARVSVLNYLLCKLGAILNLATVADLVPQDYGARLWFNKDLSPEYVRALRETKVK